MKHSLQLSLRRGGALAVLALAASFGSAPAFAGGTPSGTKIDNTATLSYSVGTVQQKDIGSSQGGNTSGAGTPTSFVVDTKVNVQVATQDGSAASVVPGQKNVARTFTVTNTGNKTLDFALSAGDPTGAAATVLGVTDNKDVSGTCTIDTGGSAITKLAGLVVDTPVNVTVKCSIPDTVVNGDGIQVYLKATAVDSSNNPLVHNTGANDLTKEEIVLADAAGSDDALHDASHSARSAYKVVTAALTVTKTFKSLCDPVNGQAVNTANIPGAFVQYTVSISNSSTAGDSAFLSTIKDELSKNVTFDPSLIQGLTADTCTLAGPGLKGVATSALNKGIKVVQTNRGASKFLNADLNDANLDGAALNAPTDSAISSNALSLDFTKILPDTDPGYGAGELKKGETVQVIFNVQIN